MSFAVAQTTRRAAHRQASTAPIAVIAADLQKVLGPSLTTVALGMRDSKAISAWAKGTRTPRPAQESLLRSLAQVASLLGSVDAPDVVRAWFSGMNPELDDRAPALVFREDPVAVLRAAETFLVAG